MPSNEGVLIGEEGLIPSGILRFERIRYALDPESNHFLIRDWGWYSRSTTPFLDEMSRATRSGSSLVPLTRRLALLPQ